MVNRLSAAFLIAGILATGPALADKPSWAGDGRDGKHEQGDRRDSQKEPERGRDERLSHDRGAPRERGSGYFGDRHRAVVHDYYYTLSSIEPGAVHRALPRSTTVACRPDRRKGGR